MPQVKINDKSVVDGLISQYNKEPLLGLLSQEQIALLCSYETGAQVLDSIVEKLDLLQSLGFSASIFQAILSCSEFIQFINLILNNIELLIEHKITASKIIATITDKKSHINFEMFIAYRESLQAKGFTLESLLKAATYRSGSRGIELLHKNVNLFFSLGFNALDLNKILFQEIPGKALEKIIELKDKIINTTVLTKAQIAEILHSREGVNSLAIVLDNVVWLHAAGFTAEVIVKIAILEDSKKVFTLICNKEILKDLEQRGFTVPVLIPMIKSFVKKNQGVIEYRLNAALRLEALSNTKSIMMPTPANEEALMQLEEALNSVAYEYMQARIDKKVEIKQELDESETSWTDNQSSLIKEHFGIQLLERSTNLLALGYPKKGLLQIINNRFPHRIIELLSLKGIDLENASFTKEQLIKLALNNGRGAYILELVWCHRNTLKELFNANELSFDELMLILKHHKVNEIITILCSSEQVIQTQYGFENRKQVKEAATKHNIDPRLNVKKMDLKQTGNQNLFFNQNQPPINTNDEDEEENDNNNNKHYATRKLIHKQPKIIDSKLVEIDADAQRQDVSALAKTVIFARFLEKVKPRIVGALPENVSTIHLLSDLSKTAVQSLPTNVILVYVGPNISKDTLLALPKHVTSIGFYPGVSIELVRALPKRISQVYIKPDVGDDVVRALPLHIDTVCICPNTSLNAIKALPNHVRCVGLYQNVSVDTINVIPEHAEIIVKNNQATPEVQELITKHNQKIHSKRKIKEVAEERPIQEVKRYKKDDDQDDDAQAVAGLLRLGN